MRRLIMIVLVLAAVGSTASASASAVILLRPGHAGTPTMTAGHPGPAQVFNGPGWSIAAAPVPREFFGVTLNSSTGRMPTFEVGAVRLWDSQTRWSQLERQRGVYDWSVLDTLVAGARRMGLPVLFTFGGTPPWAAPDGPKAAYPEGARTAPPDDLSNWDSFVRAVVARFRGRIEAYELWVLATDARLYSGSVETLVEMVRRAGRIIRSVDRNAVVVCPGMGNLWESRGRRILREFAAAGGYNYCDVAGVKLYQRTASDPPETMLDLVGNLDRAFHEAGVHPRIWNTGTTYSIPLESRLDDTTATNYAVRFFLTGLQSRVANLERMYFYNWGGTKIPIVLQGEGGSPTRAARAVEQLEQWIRGATLRSCGHGAPIDLPNNVWRCEFTLVDKTPAYPGAVLWTDEGTATVTAAIGVTRIKFLDGGSTVIRPGDPITVTEAPVLVGG